MNNPTQQEMMDFVDGTLSSQRHKEVELIISLHPHLQKQIAVLRAFRRTVGQDLIESPSKYFTSNVMNHIIPAPHRSIVQTIAGNSSNIFAMALVLATVGFVVFAGPAEKQKESNLFTRSIESYTTLYSNAMAQLSAVSKEVFHPVNQTAQSPSGKFLVMGIFAFILFMILDETIGKKYYRSGMRQ